MITTKTRAAEALTPMLSAFHSVADRPLRAVWHVCTEGSLDRIIFDFGQISMIVAADENDDSIDLTVADTPDLRNLGGDETSHLEPWNNLIGKPFGWGWVTINQQGYSDGLLLSFGGIVPQIILNVMASSIKISKITAAA
jgi:hypothetical protein